MVNIWVAGGGRFWEGQTWVLFWACAAWWDVLGTGFGTWFELFNILR